jgi:hypothetical protein
MIYKNQVFKGMDFRNQGYIDVERKKDLGTRQDSKDKGTV